MTSVLDMLVYKRPAGSETERAFIRDFIAPYKPIELSKNQVITVPGDPYTLFSCHTDTVHRKEGVQVVIHDAVLNIAYKDDDEPLGADNSAGVWILLHMIEQGVPGTYVFHYGEEKGCIGSREMATSNPLWLGQFRRAIAFDRRGTSSVITHQMNSRCCSDTFAKALSQHLGQGYAPDNTGLYTDTAHYASIISECTNISVGYAHEHGPQETLDLDHLEWLGQRVIDVPWNMLPYDRTPVPRYSTTYDYDADDTPYVYGAYTFDKKPAANDARPAWMIEDEALMTEAYTSLTSTDEALDLVLESPEKAASMLYAFVWRMEQEYANDEEDIDLLTARRQEAEPMFDLH